MAGGDISAMCLSEDLVLVLYSAMQCVPPLSTMVVPEFDMFCCSWDYYFPYWWPTDIGFLILAILLAISRERGGKRGGIYIFIYIYAQLFNTVKK